MSSEVLPQSPENIGKTVFKKTIIFENLLGTTDYITEHYEYKLLPCTKKCFFWEVSLIVYGERPHLMEV